MLFLYKKNKSRYGTLISQIENDMLNRNFPKTVTDACRILARWKNCYGNREMRFTEANDGIAFCTIESKLNERQSKRRKPVRCARMLVTTPMSVTKRTL